MASPSHRDPVERAVALRSLFCESAAEFGAMRGVMPAELPKPYGGLLDHQSHMTVAMERFSGSPVGLRVVASREEPADRKSGRGWYGREILLFLPDGTVIQYGIVRIDLGRVDAATAAAIREARIPLGRILIAAGVLRDVHDVSLIEVFPGPHLQALFQPQAAGTSGKQATYGRVAEISLDGMPAVELLEIAAPGLLPKVLR
jgi:hypothetical protein